LLAIFAVAIVATRSEPPAKPVGEPLGLTLAMVFVLFTYGGWSDVAFVGAEMQNPRRNVLRALVLGIAGVTLIYILVSLAFVKVLGFEGVRQSKAVASETLRVTSGWSGAALVSALICVSALGAVNGMIFTGARIYVAFGRDHPLFAWLGTWNARLGTPVRSHLAQGLVTLLLILLFGTPWWSGAVALLTGEQAAGGSDSHAGFQRMVIFTTPAFWFFILLVGLALFKLRDQDSQTPRPFSVPWYPFLPFVFCQFSYFMLTSSLIYAYDHRSYEAFWAVAVVVLGVVTALTLARGPTKRPSP
jgi:amino acid transporter